MALPSSLTQPRACAILDSIKGMFATKGFDGASMQDLARAAGMSAGNFYRYFNSKNAIVEAMIQRDLDEVQNEFTLIMQSKNPLETLRVLIRHRIDLPPEDHGPIWAEIEATAARRPEIAALLARMETEITRNLVAVFARIASVSVETAEQRFTAHAGLILMLIQGLTIRSGCAIASGTRGPDHALAALVMATIERTLAEIAAPGAQTTPNFAESSA